jgi:putative redox protein
MREVHVRTASGKFGQKIQIGAHTLAADEAQDASGDDTGPAPHELLLAALGSCTSMTVKLYADRKEWPLEAVHVALNGRHDEGGFLIERTLQVEGALSAEQKARLVEIAEKCPVAKTLRGTIRISTTLGNGIVDDTTR